MDASLGRALTTLPKDGLLRIRDGQGMGIAVFRGCAWITQHADSRDVVLEAGESFSLDRPGLAIVQALEDTSLLVFEGGAMPPGPGASDATNAAPASVDPATRATRIASHELHRLARRMRREAFSRAIRQLAAALLRLWGRSSGHLRAARSDGRALIGRAESWARA